VIENSAIHIPHSAIGQGVADTDHACLPVGRDTNTLFSNYRIFGREITLILESKSVRLQLRPASWFLNRIKKLSYNLRLRSDSKALSAMVAFLLKFFAGKVLHHIGGHRHVLWHFFVDTQLPPLIYSIRHKMSSYQVIRITYG
jgi:hypothetical protein